TTHSPFAFCNDSYLSFYNVINKTSSSVSNTSLKNYKENERLQIYKETLNNNAQFFFADKVVFAEGATEEIVLPIYFKKYFKKEPYYKNISIVGVGGNNYKYFIKIANDLKIPWYVFSDGEQNTINKLEKNLSYGLNLQNINIANYPNVIIIPNGFDYEKYLQVNGYSDIMIKSISGKIGENCLTFKGWMRKNHGNKIKGKERDYKSKGAKERALEDFFNKEKILHAKDVAEAISRSRIGIPKIIEELFIEIEKE
ncbi:MAG: ATP-dependent endonuclease, partial [Clostridia bacterium]|nr:ATP-dependent endonuclease [Clostridia bacterium]